MQRLISSHSGTTNVMIRTRSAFRKHKMLGHSDESGGHVMSGLNDNDEVKDGPKKQPG
jgi:hypothetical protein